MKDGSQNDKVARRSGARRPPSLRPRPFSATLSILFEQRLIFGNASVLSNPNWSRSGDYLQTQLSSYGSPDQHFASYETGLQKVGFRQTEGHMGSNQKRNQVVHAQTEMTQNSSLLVEKSFPEESILTA